MIRKQKVVIVILHTEPRKFRGNIRNITGKSIVWKFYVDRFQVHPSPEQGWLSSKGRVLALKVSERLCALLSSVLLHHFLLGAFPAYIPLLVPVVNSALLCAAHEFLLHHLTFLSADLHSAYLCCGMEFLDDSWFITLVLMSIRNCVP